MHEFIEFLKQFDLFTILSLGILIWYFTKEIGKSLGIKIDSVESKIESLDKDVRAMNTRISRLEGTVYGKEIYKHIDEPK